MVFGDLPPHRIAHVLGGSRARALVQVLGQQPPAISVPAAVAALPTPTPPAPAEAIQAFRASLRGRDDVLRASLHLAASAALDRRSLFLLPALAGAGVAADPFREFGSWLTAVGISNFGQFATGGSAHCPLPAGVWVLAAQEALRRAG
eukprot:15428722-Alexandrium_andersonii.AAC.1